MERTRARRGKRRYYSRDYRIYLRLSRLPRHVKRLIMLIADAIILPIALYSAYVLRTGEWLPSELVASWWLLLLAPGIGIPIFARFGLYRAVVRFMGAQAVFVVFKGVTLATIILAVPGIFIATPKMPWSTLAIFWLSSTLYIGASRFLVRSYFQRQRHRHPATHIIIYGAGDAGAHLSIALSNSKQRFVPVAFVDDNDALQGSEINGLPVHGPEELPKLIKQMHVTSVLLAMPSVRRRIRHRILTRLEALPVHVRTMPDVTDLALGRARVDDIREVDVGDLLGRDAVPPDPALLDACVRNKTVMVTGAGGSIGSELCRQIIELKPNRLVLLEISELALYEIDRELQRVHGRLDHNVEVVPLLGSVHHRRRINDAMRSFGVQTVYHAAAYKHVPIVEQNVIEGVYNNIFGTLRCAQAAADNNVESFVLVSTDKAVSPTNVMGATKRFAEMILQATNERAAKTKFCMVRFGNVLASSGSVVPVFREQIRSGGPVTVTHPDIIRYFMTIPEAAQLVIQAGSMANGGDVFLLDMGKPVKIEDLARRMIHLMGLEVRDENHPDGEIEIMYTGLRPAEKLYEELLIGVNASGTRHPRIMRAEEDSLPWGDLEYLLKQLLVAAKEFNVDRVRKILMGCVSGYVPTSEVQDLVWATKQNGQAQAGGATVTPIRDSKPTSD